MNNALYLNCCSTYNGSGLNLLTAPSQLSPQKFLIYNSRFSDSYHIAPYIAQENAISAEDATNVISGSSGNVKQSTYNDENGKWCLEAEIEEGLYYIRNKQTGLYMTLSGDLNYL